MRKLSRIKVERTSANHLVDRKRQEICESLVHVDKDRLCVLYEQRDWEQRKILPSKVNLIKKIVVESQ